MCVCVCLCVCVSTLYMRTRPYTMNTRNSTHNYFQGYFADNIFKRAKSYFLHS